MEDQIRKIIEENYDPDWEELGLKKSAKEITSHVMEFIHWLFKGCPFVIGENATGKIIAMNIKYGNTLTLEELYQYWLTIKQ